MKRTCFQVTPVIVIKREFLFYGQSSVHVSDNDQKSYRRFQRTNWNTLNQQLRLTTTPNTHQRERFSRTTAAQDRRHPVQVARDLEQGTEGS
jgi:hypothetical protein